MAKTINEAISIIAKGEVYKGSKNPKKPQVSVGNIREIYGLICDLVTADPEHLKLMLDTGIKRKKAAISKAKK